MALDVEQYNYEIDPSLQYSIRVIAGICTQLIDTPVTRASLLFENRSLLQLPETHCIFPGPRRRDISVYLDQIPNNGIPNRLRGITILFGISITSHLSSFLLDKIIPKSASNTRYSYSDSMHLYNKCKQQNLSINIAHNQIVDANLIDPDESHHHHNWDHDRLIRKIIISSFCSLLTFPLYCIYTRIAFDIGTLDKDSHIRYKYPINAVCSNIMTVGKQMIQQNNALYNGFRFHFVYNMLYQTLLHYTREILIEISPMIHSSSFVHRYLSKKHDPFEYSMFCIWWIPPVLCRIVCYPLIKAQNKYILNGNMDIGIGFNWMQFMKTLFHGVIGNTTRFMTEIQMCELFGLWSLIRIAHKKQYKQLIFEQEHTECTICYGDKGRADIVFVPCGHKFCREDADDVLQRNMNCPTCRRPIQNSFTDLGAWKKLFML